MGKTRNFLEKTRDTKWTFYAKMGIIKDRNGMNLKEAEGIKNMWQKCTELYKKVLMTWITMIAWSLTSIQTTRSMRLTLGSITSNKVSGGNGISAELFQILKDDTIIVLHSICQQIWKTSSGHGTGKGQFSLQSQRRTMPKNAQTTIQLCSFHMLGRLCWKSFKWGFKSLWTENSRCASWI